MAPLTAGLVVLMVPGIASAKQEPDGAAIERVVSAYAERAGYQGIAATITRGNRVLYAGGYGHDSAGDAVTATTPLPVASVSKSFTALAVLRLVEAGKVELDAPVRSYLPDFRIADPRGSQITVRQLLNQTSGITDGTLPEKSLPQPDSLAGAVTRARNATLAVEPGTRHFYTNTNYHLAARLVEVVAGESFKDHLERRVLQPIGMGATTTIDQTPRDLPRDVRRGYVYAYGASIPAAEPKRFVNGSDGVITTASDLAKWLIVQNNAGLAANGTRLVSAASITAMHTSSDPRWTYGMGWATDQQGRVDHSGIWFTHSSHALLLPGGYGIAVIGNGGIGLANEGIAPLADALAALVTGGTPPAGAPVRLIVDLTLAGLTLLTLLLGIRSLQRTRTWADRFAGRPPWRLALRLLPRLAPLALLVALPDLIGGIVGGGRDITFFQLCYYAVALVGWTAAAAVTNAAVLTARVVALWRPRRPADNPPALDTPPQLVTS
ncbi:serine hydrolase domain-containing protein [Micromonospora sp. NPDC004336]